MGWIGRLLGAVPKEEMQGVHLDLTQPYWEVQGPKTFRDLFVAIRGWFPEDAILYFEGGYEGSEIHDFMVKYAIKERTHIALGTIWPRPKVFHVPATDVILTELIGIAEHHAEPELAVHFHIYRNDTVLLEWHDAFDQPMLINGEITVDQIKALCGKFGTNFKRIVEQGVPADAARQNRGQRR